MLKLISIDKNSCLAEGFSHNVTYYDTEAKVFVEFIKREDCDEPIVPLACVTKSVDGSDFDWLACFEEFGLHYTSFWRDEDVEYGGFLQETIGRICV